MAQSEHLTRICKALSLIPSPREVKKGRREEKGGEERKEERAKEGRQLRLGLLDLTKSVLAALTRTFESWTTSPSPTPWPFIPVFCGTQQHLLN